MLQRQSSEGSSLAAVENIYKAAQDLHKRKEFPEAISQYLVVCQTLERSLALGRRAHVDVYWGILSIGGIADIYFELADWQKSLAYRKIQKAFLDIFEHRRDPTEDTDEESDLIAITNQYLALFKRVHDANELPDKPPPETPEAIMERLTNARKKEEEQKIDRVIQLLNQASDSRDRQIRESFWRRNLQRALDHPVIVVIIVLVFVSGLLFLVNLSPTVKIPDTAKVRAQFDDKFGKIQDLMRDIGQQPPPPPPHGHDHDHHRPDPHDL
jgi:hypothetical protein